MAIDFPAVARASQVARVAHHSTTSALLGVSGAVWVLPGDNLKKLAQDFVEVVGLELGL